jgi:hypothetical protein
MSIEQAAALQAILLLSNMGRTQISATQANASDNGFDPGMSLIFEYL